MSSTALPKAATILLVTRSGRVLVCERSIRARFLGGFVAFPGGMVDSADEALARELFGAQGDDEIGKAAALRELFEETGIVLEGARARPAPKGTTTAAEAYRALSQRPKCDALTFGARWITPESAISRFDTRFYLASVEEPAPVRVQEDELAWADFVEPKQALDRWRRLDWLLAPPTRHALEVLELGLEEAPRRLSAIPEASGGESVEFEGIQGVRVIPLRTPTLPPARHTNAYVLGDERLIVVDPATYEESEREKLLERIEERVRGGAELLAVVLTHHHVDHVGAAMWLKRRLGCPIWAHPITRSLLDGKVEIDRTLVEGDRIELGQAQAGGAFSMEVYFTPGHDPGHIVLWDRRTSGRVLIAGDMVAGLGTIIIDPPEGDMAEYVAQLSRLARLIGDRGIVAPAHGPPSVDGRGKLEEYLRHRSMREEKVIRALEQRGRSRPIDLLDLAYDDTSPALYPLAARSCLAHLLKLVKDGRVESVGDRFVARPGG